MEQLGEVTTSKIFQVKFVFRNELTIPVVIVFRNEYLPEIFSLKDCNY